MENVHYLDGKWVKTEDVKISAFDITVLRGFGIFDFLRTYNEKPFLLEEHINRLFNSAKTLGIHLSKNKKEIEQLIFLGIKKNKNIFSDFNIRILVTGGIGVDSTTPGKPQFLIIFSQAVDYPRDYYKKGVKVITYNAQRIFPSAKTINYLHGILAFKKSKQNNAVEALYVDQKDNIYEAITSNFFAFIDNKLVTPKEEILKGVTREVILKLAKQKKIKTVERNINLKELSQFQEAFITASNKEIMPVVQIDNRKVGSGMPGPVTKELLAAYRDIIHLL